MHRPRPVSFLMRVCSEEIDPELRDSNESLYLGENDTVASKILRENDIEGLNMMRRVCNLNIAFNSFLTLAGIVMTATKWPIEDVDLTIETGGELIEKIMEYGPGIATTALCASFTAEFLEMRRATNNRILEINQA